MRSIILSRFDLILYESQLLDSTRCLDDGVQQIRARLGTNRRLRSAPSRERESPESLKCTSNVYVCVCMFETIWIAHPPPSWPRWQQQPTHTRRVFCCRAFRKLPCLHRMLTVCVCAVVEHRAGAARSSQHTIWCSLYSVMTAYCIYSETRLWDIR